VSDAYRAHLRRRLEESDVPETIHSGLVEYFAARRPVGGFLTAVLHNAISATPWGARTRSARWS